eukprot:scaffold1469_cov119-Cylindrotheca_fusiformis.AAC.9
MATEFIEYLRKSAVEMLTLSFYSTEATAANVDPKTKQGREIVEEKTAYEPYEEEEKLRNELVIETWGTVKAIPDYQHVAGDILFRRLFELNPDALGLFSFAKKYKAGDEALYEDKRFRKHASGVIDTVTAAVSLIEEGNMELLVSVLQDLGARHAKYDLVKVHYDMVGESLLYTLEKALGDAFTPQVKEAWVQVYGIITEQMMRGAAVKSSTNA